MSTTVTKYNQTILPVSIVRKTRNKITIPAFSLVCGGATSYGISVRAGIISVTLSQKTSIKYPVAQPTSSTCLLIIKFTNADASVSRYALWSEIGEIIGLNVQKYVGQRLPTTFEIEVWGIPGNTTAVLAADLDLYVGILSLREGITPPTVTSLVTLTVNSDIRTTFPISTTDDIDFDGPFVAA